MVMVLFLMLVTFYPTIVDLPISVAVALNIARSHIRCCDC